METVAALPTIPLSWYLILAFALFTIGPRAC